MKALIFSIAYLHFPVVTGFTPQQNIHRQRNFGIRFIACTPIALKSTKRRMVKRLETKDDSFPSCLTRLNSLPRVDSQWCDNDIVLPSSVYSTIRNGKVAVLSNFIPESEISKLRAEADDLFNDDSAHAENGIIRPHEWNSEKAGNFRYRKRIENVVMSIRKALALHLNMPGLETKIAIDNSEFTIIRYKPGDSLGRHVDDHHEEKKGAGGWLNSTRRSIGWFIYINDSEWDIEKDGGALRCFERRNAIQGRIGAAPNGDVQIGWLGASPVDQFDRPVYMEVDVDGGCRMYVCDGETKAHISRTFQSHPLLYSGFETPDLAKETLLVDDRSLSERFRLIEPLGSTPPPNLIFPDEEILDVAPSGGTFVLFDAIAVPHEVLYVKKVRTGYHGFFHEEL